MKKYSYHLVWLAGIYLLSAFTANDTPYEQEIQQWHQKRVESLKAESGWLNLAGLFWLEEGKNTFGGDGKNNVNFPADKSKPFLGEIILEKGKVTLKANADAEVFNGEAPVTELDIFPNEKPVTLSHKTLRWFIIKRGDKYAVRLRDLESEYLKGFSGIERYPVQENWRVKARFEPTTGKKVSITDITGRTADQDSPGTLVFNVNGKEYKLYASSEVQTVDIRLVD